VGSPPNDETVSPADDLLESLDALRSDRFNGNQRRAAAELTDLAAELHKLRPDGLLDLAHVRDLFIDAVPTGEDLQGALTQDFDNGQKLCGQIEDRILDTAVFGVDLYAIEFDRLEKLADELDVDGPTFGWKDHDQVVPALRARLRPLALSGSGPDFRDLRGYPRRVSASADE
jgi:hypothetical protein